MNKRIEKEIIVTFLKNRKSVTNGEIYNLFSKKEPGIKKSTVNWRIHYLTDMGLISRIGRGIYGLGSEKKFKHGITAHQRRVSKEVAKQFPFIKYCVWDVSVLKEFVLHIFNINFLIIEAERDASSSVFQYIKDSNNSTFLDPDERVMEEYVLTAKSPIIVKPLISEAPVNVQGEIKLPSLEKILVDIVSDKDMFYFIQGSEIINIYKSASEKYTINFDRLYRYAKRRNSYDDIKSIFDQINGNK
ncbi:MAG TPA: hypothetical protein PLK90_10205 [Clostridiales bacterium]|nr:hypothetical protein [Clostridiales bacterium]HQP70759.1 hypothetical protein [Clostridiales bacterium]